MFKKAAIRRAQSLISNPQVPLSPILRCEHLVTRPTGSEATLNTRLFICFKYKNIVSPLSPILRCEHLVTRPTGSEATLNTRLFNMYYYLHIVKVSSYKESSVPYLQCSGVILGCYSEHMIVYPGSETIVNTSSVNFILIGLKAAIRTAQSLIYNAQVKPSRDTTYWLGNYRKHKGVTAAIRIAQSLIYNAQVKPSRDTTYWLGNYRKHKGVTGTDIKILYREICCHSSVNFILIGLKAAIRIAQSLIYNAQVKPSRDTTYWLGNYRKHKGVTGTDIKILYREICCHSSVNFILIGLKAAIRTAQSLIYNAQVKPSRDTTYWLGNYRKHKGVTGTDIKILYREICCHSSVNFILIGLKAAIRTAQSLIYNAQVKPSRDTTYWLGNYRKHKGVTGTDIKILYREICCHSSVNFILIGLKAAIRTAQSLIYNAHMKPSRDTTYWLGNYRKHKGVTGTDIKISYRETLLMAMLPIAFL
ncbi:hypothetical protein J6590_104692 [Homalodisca vitripennis]|nr:hypothetical protein J6590_104692 [Homalodisca vitripennis]